MFFILFHMLIHRSGTLYEDMYWIDSEKVDIITREINSFEEEQILYSESIKTTCKNGKKY